MPIMAKTTAVTHILTSANTIGNAAIGGSVAGGGILWWFGENATAVGAICVVIGLIAGIIFKIIGHVELKRHHRKIEGDG